jgi:hypothetical protein
VAFANPKPTSDAQLLPISAMTPGRIPLTKNQVRGFWAAWAGWALDGMDSFIYALVLVPALADLLPRSGISPTTANVGYYGGLLFAVFLIGWGMALLWGPVADRPEKIFGGMTTLHADAGRQPFLLLPIIPGK